MRVGPPAPAFLVAVLLAVAGCVVEPEPSEGALLDATGTYVDVSDLSRIVPTSHDLVEVLFELGHAERVVAVPNWIDHPVDSKALPACTHGGDPEVRCSMGRPHVLNVEEVVTAAPTLVLLKDHPLQPTDLTQQLRRIGIPVFVFSNEETLDNIHTTYQTVAQILEPVDAAVVDRADARLEALDHQQEAIRQRVANSSAPHPVTLYQLPSAFVAGAGTSADLLLGLAGARNLAAEAGMNGYQQISREVLLDRDPERVVASFTAASHPDVFFDNPRYAETTAAHLGPETLRIVDPAVTALVGPRFLDGAEELAAWFHPVAFGHFTVDQVALQQDGHEIAIDVQVANLSDGPARYRFDAGDGSPVQENGHGSFHHAYESTGDRIVRLLVIDDVGRIHEERWNLQVTP